MSAWRESSLLSPLPEEGERVKPGYIVGNRFGLEDFSAGTYPSCSRHGAMNRVSSDVAWYRCLEPGCNIGCALCEGEE